jgi:hypothetical protein
MKKIKVLLRDAVGFTKIITINDRAEIIYMPVLGVGTIRFKMWDFEDDMPLYEQVSHLPKRR